MASVRQQTNRPASSGMVSRAVLAVVLAFGFWAWVTNNNDPDRRQDFPNVPVTQNNLPDGLSIIDYTPQTVVVSIWGPRSVVSNPTLAAGNFSATIDLKDAKPGTQQVPIHVQSDLKNLRKKSASSSTAQVTIERSIDKMFPVTAPVPTQPGVKVNNVTATPSTVQVSGPESKVNAVAQIIATFDIGDHTANFTSTVDVKALDASGREIGGVTLSPSHVIVAADITDNRNERTVPVSTADVVGTPAPGYIFNGFGSIPQVTITGDPQVIRTIVNIPT
ncbi:MAG: CdaR family protein, partial [Chloroflexota bacterium]|nr:CdaR family protein [Chloroflexota bacterium]